MAVKASVSPCDAASEAKRASPTFESGCASNPVMDRRGLSLERALDAEIQLANHDHSHHGPVVGGDPDRTGHCLRG